MEFKELPPEQPEAPKKESAEKFIRPSPEAYGVWKESFEYFRPELLNDLTSHYPNLSNENAEDLSKKIPKYFEELAGHNPSGSYFSVGAKESKVNQELRNLLYRRFLLEADSRVKVFNDFKQAIGEDNKQFDPSMIDQTEQFRQSFNLFFKPLLRQKEIEQELNKLSETKKTLGMEHEKIGKAVHLGKPQKKEAQAELQRQILEIKKQLEPLEQQNKAAQTLVQFIPNYQREFERAKKLFKEGDAEKYQINQKVADNFLSSLVEKRLSKRL